MRTTRRMMSVAVGACLACAGVASAGLITGVTESGTGLDVNAAHFTGETFTHLNEGADYTVPSLGEDVTFFTNRLHEYNGVDTFHTIAAMNLVGAEYVMLANENRGVTDYKLTTSVSSPVDAYVFMDTRVTQPAWLTDHGWSFLGSGQMGIDEAGDGVGSGVAINNRFYIWKKSITESSFDTFERGGTGNNMYGVAVTAPGAGLGQAPAFSLGSFGLIDIGATGGRAEPGALTDTGGVAQIGAAAHNVNDVNLPVTQMTSATGDTFTIAIDNIDQTGAVIGLTDWRDRGDSKLSAAPFSVALPQLAEDHVKNNAGILRVILGDLPGGRYDVTGYFLDSTGAQCEAIKIFVNNGNGLGYVDTGIVGSALVNLSAMNNLLPQYVMEHSATFSFWADGVHDVRIIFDGTDALDTEVPLAGLNINYTVPEPGAASLLALGALGLLGRRWRR